MTTNRNIQNGDHVDLALGKEKNEYLRDMSIDKIGWSGSAYRPKRASVALSKPALVQVVTYQRYSADKQGQKSEDRQLERNEDFNERRIQGVIVRRYTDRGRTGVQIEGRTELEEMLSDASKRLFSVLIIEELSRLARDREDTFRIFRLLVAYGIDVYESSTGTKLDLYSLVFKSFLAEKERVTFLTRARDGRRTAVGRGEIMHFANYGYMLDPTRPKAFLKHPENAQAVQDIFARAANGERAHAICVDISGRYPTPHDCRNIANGSVPSSTRSRWEPTSIQRIVENPIYAGILIDGRTVRVHDPENYDIKADIPVDSTQWQRVDVPDLALVSLETWFKAQEAFTSQGCSQQFGQGHRYLLKNLTFCAGCGQPVKIAFKGEYECHSRRIECRGIGHLPAAQLERKVLNLLGNSRLPTSDCCSAPKMRGLQALNPESDEFRDALRIELDDLEQELNDDIVSLCHSGDASQEKIDHWKRLEKRIETLRRQGSLLRNSTASTSLSKGDLSEFLRNWNSDVPFSLDDPRAEEVKEVVRSNVDRIVIDLREHEYYVEVHLHLHNSASQDELASSVVVGSFPNLDTHDDGIRAETLRERTMALGRTRPSTLECARLIEELEGCGQAEIKVRLQAVLECIKGATCCSVAEALGGSEHHILQWLIIYREAGLEILLTKSAADITSIAKNCIASDNDALMADAKTTILKDRINLSKKVLLLAFDGVTPSNIANQLGITRKLVFTILIGMEVAGYEGTLKARRPRINLTEADLDRIRNVITTGVDPSDTGSALTQKSLLAWCKTEFHIEQVDTSLRNFLSRKAIRVSDAPKLGLSRKDQEGRNIREFIKRGMTK